MSSLKITNIKIRKTYDENRLRALVSITFNDCFAVHDIKVIEGPERFFVAMPSRKEPNGNFRDIAHPINEEMRTYIENEILSEYANFVNNQPVENHTIIESQENELEKSSEIISD